MELKFIWKINNFGRLEDTELYSKIFSVECSKWRLLIFPKGKGDSINRHLSLFLDAADSSSLPIGWSRSCKFRLSVVDQIDAKYTITKDLDHEFKARESDWGFTSFMPLCKLNDLSRGYVVNDTCIIEAELDVQNVAGEDCCDSKTETTDSNNKEVTNEAKGQTCIDVDWANDTVEGMMSAALKNLRDHHLSVQGFSAMAEVLKKSFISVGVVQLFEDTWRPWIDDILQSLKELNDMEEALKMDSIEAALKESLLKIDRICQLQEVSYSKLAAEEEHAVDVGLEIANEDKLTAEQSGKELAGKDPRRKKRCAALLSSKSTLDGLRAEKAKIKRQLKLLALVEDDMEEALKMEAALRESLLKINRSCLMQEVSHSKLASEEEHAVDVGIEIANAANLTAEQSGKELAEKDPRREKRRAALLSSKSTLDGLRAQKAKMEGQLEDLQALFADGRKTLIEKKAEIRLRMQVHPTRQA